jgi:hypothetical protein
VKKQKAGFLRKTARMDRKSALRNNHTDRKIPIESEIQSIINKAKESFDEYSTVIAAFAIQTVLKEILNANIRAHPNDIKNYILEKKADVDKYLDGVVKAMGEDL